MSVMIDVVIGVVFLYLLLSLVATTIQEMIATAMRARAVHLYAALKSMLGADTLRLFEKHVLIDNLREKPGKLTERNFPSYIPSKAFAEALLDVLLGGVVVTKASGLDTVIAEVNKTVAVISNENLRRALQLFMRQVALEGTKVDDIGRILGERTEAWFNDRMARASGWYKRRAQLVALAIAAFVTGVCNADTIHVADRLWKDDALRASITATATAYHAGNTTGAPSPADADVNAQIKRLSTQLFAQTQELKEASFPIGWSRDLGGLRDWIVMLLGLLLTTLAVSLGSGFWFDILGKVLQLRGTGPKVSVSGRVEAPTAGSRRN